MLSLSVNYELEVEVDDDDDDDDDPVCDTCDEAPDDCECSYTVDISRRVHAWEHTSVTVSYNEPGTNTPRDVASIREEATDQACYADWDDTPEEWEDDGGDVDVDDWNLD